MLEESDFHFHPVISQQGLSGPSLHLLLPQSEHTSDKKPPVLRPHPSYTYTERWGELPHRGHMFISHSLHFVFYLPRAVREGPPSKACKSQAWWDGGENVVVPCSFFTQGTKTHLPHIHCCSNWEPSDTRACKNRPATEGRWRNMNGHKLYSCMLACIQMCTKGNECVLSLCSH